MNGMHGIIFSYEMRNDLRELGEIRSASSIPFGGRYRAVDFALSNLVNAGVTDVGVVLHGRYQSLLDHLGTGKDWDLSRKRGGLKILPPFAYKQSWGEAAAFRGKMEALAGVRSYLAEIRRDYVVLMDGDLVVNLPISDIYEQHIKSGADITVVCGNDSFETENGTYFEMDHSTGRITDVLYHLHRPRGYRGLEVYILSTELLLSLVDECASRDQYSLRRDVLQARKDSLKLQGYIWSGFAAQIRSVQEYYDRSMQLLEQDATFTVEFNGGETAEYVGGDFEALAVNRSATGTWAANGATRELSLHDIRTSGNDTDVLARAFLTGLTNAIRYSGDSQNLYIYYEDGQTTKYMAFHVK